MNRVKGSMSRAHPLWLAYIVHRISGIILALFLPLHFWVLAMALTDPTRLDGFLHLTEHSLVKLAEFGLVVLLAIHMFGGLRLMALEWLPWASWQKTLAAAATALAFLTATLFLLNAYGG
jgi:fumarate reductase subunit D